MKKLEASLGRSEQAAVVRTRFVELLRQGKTGEEAVEELQSMTGDQKDTQFGREFWMALADIMWNYGRLTEQVKINALRAIDSCRQVTMERRSPNRQYLLQMEYLSRLEIKLQTPQPEQKKVATYQLFVNDWEPGDVLSYRLSGAAEAYAGQLVFVHVVRKQKYFPGHIVPVVRVFRLTASRNLELKELQAGGYLPQYWSPANYDRSLDEVPPYQHTARMHDVLFNTLLSAVNVQEYRSFSKIGVLPVLELPLDRVDDANESTCRLFEVETVSALRKWKNTDVYTLLQHR